MPEKKDHRMPPIKGDDQAARESASALAELYKALKAITFYPASHPLRDEILHRAHQAMTKLMEGERLTLAVHRNGLFLDGRDGGVEDTRMTKALAKELFTREIQRMTLMPEISAGEFTDFLSLLAMEPQRIIAEGGMAAILERHGITTITANEIDIAAVYTKRKVGESTGETAAESVGADEGDFDREGTGEGATPPESIPLEQLETLSAAEIAARMEREKDDDRFRLLARYLTAKGVSLKEERNFDELFPVLLSLLNQNADETRSAARREASLEVFREIARGAMAEHLLDHLEHEDFRQKEIVYLILNQLGGEIVGDIVRRITDTDCQYSRKALTTALLRIGVPALQPLLSLLNDGRRQVVRTTVAVLGDMGNRDAVKGLTLTAYHADNRIRFESIRSLATIGGKEATELLTELLRDNNRAIRRQAILWLGISRNDKALQPLLELVSRRDLMGRNLTLKKEALLAIGRIGDQRALDPLFRLVRKRRLLAPRRWEELNILAVETIGRLGGEAAREFLERTVSRGGRLGRACAATLETIGEQAEVRNE